MTDSIETQITTIQSYINAVGFILKSFADFGNNEERRHQFLRESFEALPDLKIHFSYTEIELKDTLRSLNRQLGLLLQIQLLDKQQKGW